MQVSVFRLKKSCILGGGGVCCKNLFFYSPKPSKMWTFFFYKNILSPKICEKMSSFFVLFQYFHLLKYARKYRFLEKKIHIFEGVCGGIKKKSQKKSKDYIRVLIVSSNVRPEPTRHDTTRTYCFFFSCLIIFYFYPEISPK